jgi:hypothetical protein
MLRRAELNKLRTILAIDLIRKYKIVLLTSMPKRIELRPLNKILTIN